MKKYKSLIKKILLGVLITTLVYLFASVIIVEIFYEQLCFNQHFDYEYTINPREYGLVSKETDIKASDGVKIHIYEVMVPNPKGVVIMLTGITGPSVTHFYGEAKLVAEAGYASILVDARGHGKSEGDKITFAIDDVKDVDATVNYIKGHQRYDDLPIIVMGLSMGGATAINAGSLNQDIDGIIALSPFSSWTDVCIDTVEVHGWPRWIGELLRPGIVIHGFLRHGMDFFRIAPEKTIQQAGDKPILILRSRDDAVVTLQNQDRLDNSYNGSNMDVIIKDGDDHHVVDIKYPFKDIDYCNAILAFLKTFNTTEEGVSYGE